MMMKDDDERCVDEDDDKEDVMWMKIHKMKNGFFFFN